MNLSLRTSLLVILSTTLACGDDGSGDTSVDAGIDDTGDDGSAAADVADDAPLSRDGESNDSDVTDSDSTEPRDAGPDVDFSQYDPYVAGPWSAAVTRSSFVDEERGRVVPVEVWYPTAADEGSGESVTVFAAEGSDRTALEALLDAAPAECTSRRTAAGRDAQSALETADAPLVVISHCHGCTRYAYARLAESLAARGFVVAAPDHVGNTLFDTLRDQLAPLDATTLAMRTDDVSAVIDLMLGEQAPAAVRGLVDVDHIAVIGHSFGSVTAGSVLATDDRARVGIGLAAPFESPLLPGVAMSDIDERVLFVVATEDNSITEFGNNFLRDNFEDSVEGSFKLELIDAGHWSFTEICALTEGFDACCGDARRQTNQRAFTYPPVERYVSDVNAYAFAFLDAALLGNPVAEAWLRSRQGETETLTLQRREAP